MTAESSILPHTLLALGFICLLVSVFCPVLGWRIVPQFKKLNDNNSAWLDSSVGITQRSKIADIPGRWPVELRRLILCHHLKPSIDEAFDTASSDAVSIFVLSIAIAFLLAAALDAFSIFNLDIYAAFALFVGGGELIFFIAIFTRLAALRQQVKQLLQAAKI